ncbi:MAG: putative transporter [bacterium]
MKWIVDLVTGHSVAQAVLVLSAVITLGVAVGHLKYRGVGLGIAGVLFTGLVFGHFHLTVNDEVLEFMREFGLILFVYTIGMQVGPGFFASFRKQGLKFNLMAAAIVFLGVGVALAIYYIAGLPLEVVVGLLAGAVTNTPSLGAAQQALADRMGQTSELAQLPGLGYAVAYPFGIMGIIVAMLLVRVLFRINPRREAEEFEQQHASVGAAPVNYNIEVTNPRLAGQPVPMLASILKTDFVISRLLRGETVIVPTGDTRLQLGDILHVVCAQESADKLAIIVGDVSKVDVRAVPSQLSARNILITQNDAVGKSISELDLMRRYDAAITRVHRAGIELVASAGMELCFGDRVTVVGSEGAIKKVSVELGDSLKQLNYPNILPVFIGIILGVLLGSLPISIPGVPAPVKLGLAGGPLLVAIFFSRYARVGPVVWYLPQSANLTLREVGIALFLACVGLRSGGRFVETLVHGDGVYWMFLAALITVIPLVIVGFVARAVYKVNFLSVCGLLAGSMTDPPALSFANSITASDAPAITYASVYPLVMFLRILTAQAMVMFLAR